MSTSNDEYDPNNNFINNNSYDSGNNNNNDSEALSYANHKNIITIKRKRNKRNKINYEGDDSGNSNVDNDNNCNKPTCGALRKDGESYCKRTKYLTKCGLCEIHHLAHHVCRNFLCRETIHQNNNNVIPYVPKKRKINHEKDNDQNQIQNNENQIQNNENQIRNQNNENQIQNQNNGQNQNNNGKYYFIDLTKDDI